MQRLKDYFGWGNKMHVVLNNETGLIGYPTIIDFNVLCLTTLYKTPLIIEGQEFILKGPGDEPYILASINTDKIKLNVSGVWIATRISEIIFNNGIKQTIIKATRTPRGK